MQIGLPELVWTVLYVGAYHGHHTKEQPAHIDVVLVELADVAEMLNVDAILVDEEVFQLAPF